MPEHQQQQAPAQQSAPTQDSGPSPVDFGSNQAKAGGVGGGAGEETPMLSHAGEECTTLNPCTIDDVPPDLEVVVKSAPLREQPSAMGKVLATLPHKTPVHVLDGEKSWARVSTQEGEGWIRQQWIIHNDVRLRAGDADLDTYATDEEVAIAGKG